MYLIRKGKEYFFPIIDESVQKEALELLSSKEKTYFLEMGKYDRYHSLEVYRKIKETSLKKKEIYLKMALLHDCGKEKIGIIIRVLHKLGIKTGLGNHAEKGYEKLKEDNMELAVLIRNHHNKCYSEEMKIFQKYDDES